MGIDAGQDAYVRVKNNASKTGTTYNGVAPGKIVFDYSTDYGQTWTQLGAVVSGATGGISRPSGSNAQNRAAGTVGSFVFAGNIYKVYAKNEAGLFDMNPDFTALASGQTGTFADTAGTPNTWTINGTVS